MSSCENKEESYLHPEARQQPPPKIMNLSPPLNTTDTMLKVLDRSVCQPCTRNLKHHRDINGQEKINAWLQRELIKSSTMMCFTQQFISRE
jgi:hypothetical protein